MHSDGEAFVVTTAQQPSVCSHWEFSALFSVTFLRLGLHAWWWC